MPPLIISTTQAPRGGRVFRTFNQDIESVGLAVLTFLSGGIFMFISCFIVTKLLQCYKARLRRKRRKAMGEDDDDNDFNAAYLSGQMDFEDSLQEDSSTNDSESRRLTNP